MPAYEEAIILTRLAGVREFLAGTTAEAGAMERLGLAADTTGLAFTRTSHRGFLMNQALFTMRRFAYGATIGIIALGAEVLHLGFNYNSAMQTASVALAPVFSSTQALHQELIDLFNFTKYTPFQFKDVTTAFRVMYFGMKPLGITIKDVNHLLAAMTDALAAVGKDSPGALNRVSVALQHMAYLGHLTGQVVNQLNRDGLPFTAALKTQLGLTSEQIHNIGRLNITSKQALEALTRYIESPASGMEGAARRIATGSLHGLFTTFKDDMSQLFGTFELKPFLGTQNKFADLNAFLDKLTNVANNGGSIKDIMNVIAHALAPGNPGAFLFVWDQLSADLTDVWKILVILISTVTHSTLVWGTVALVLLAVRGGLEYILHNTWWLVPALKVVIGLFIVWKTYLIATSVAEARVAFMTALNTKAFKELTFFQAIARAGLVLYYFALGRLILFLRTARAVMAAYTTALILMTRESWLYSKAVAAMEAVQAAWNALLTYGAAAMTELSLAILANPVTWLVIGIIALTAVLVVLYLKWDRFHDAVNGLFNLIKSNSALIATALKFAFAPLFLAIDAIREIQHRWDQITAPIKKVEQVGHSIVKSSGGSDSFFGGLEKSIIHGFEENLPGVGTALKIERAVRSVAKSATPRPTSPPLKAPAAPVPETKSIFNFPEAWMTGQQHTGKTTHVTVKVGRKVLAEAYAQEQGDALARR